MRTKVWMTKDGEIYLSSMFYRFCRYTTKEGEFTFEDESFNIGNVYLGEL
jgi:hypothetical protein